jgi:predicted ATP-binding protein involved in virulence
MIRRRIGSLNLEQLSDGEQRLFSLFVDIARQLSLLNPNNEIGSGQAMVLIDEIDVHLHPKWQRKIVPALEDLFRNCQFIATSHSPFVIQAVDRKKIIIADSNRRLARDSQNNSIEDISEEIQGVDLPQRSLRAKRLSEAAEKYFRLLKNSKRSSTKALRDAEREYREASEPYTMEPAAHALLKIAKLEAKK